MATVAGRSFYLPTTPKPPNRDLSATLPPSKILYQYHRTKLLPLSMSYSRNPKQDDETLKENGSSAHPDDDGVSIGSSTVQDSGSFLSKGGGGCKGCGREVAERGCNEEGRIQGGIAAVPGFGWWPIKAFRPCPSFLASGGKYRRVGQSMDEVVSGRAVTRK
ncbi:unnamed protein product [Cuscuta epithymum]|uniref:Uncharacterized protein n=1 Tax=Cuscuta epithymum TaxID=186058 RepID=A0AAV0G0E0_9ASTE|nr:unnamed protein product [Cuscuta epithymum]